MKARSRHRVGRLFAAILLALSSVTPLAAAPPAGFARAQAVEIDPSLADDGASGWVAVRLDPSASRHLGVDLTVLSPAGESLPWASLHGSEGRHPARIESLRKAREAGRDGVWIQLDLGPEPPRHTRLHFGIGERSALSDLRLQASSDGDAWSDLVRGDLFRLGDSESFQALALDYPATDARHLRLFWPGDEAPLLERVWVLGEGEGVTRRDLDPVATDEAPGRGFHGVWTLVLDVPRQTRRLDLRLYAAGHFGLRLHVADAGTWRPLAEETRRAGDGMQTVRIPLALERRQAATLRLETWGAVVEGAHAWIAEPVVGFRPAGAGRHLVTWGATTTAGRQTTRPPVRDRWPRVEASALETAPWPALPARLAGQAAPLPERSYVRVWGLDPQSPDTAPGDVVILRLPAEVYAATGGDPGALRLAAGGRLIPHVLLADDEPVPLLSHRAAPARGREPGQTKGRSVVEIAAADLPAGDIPYSELRLRAPGPFSRFFRLSWERPAAGGEAPRSVTILGRPWQCLAADVLPCELVENVQATPGADLRLGIDDGDDTPLPWVELDLWGRRHSLVFVWPQAGEAPRLYADPDLPAASYDLAALDGLLLSRPASEVRLGTEEAAASEAASREWLLYGALGLAVVVLLLLLGRMLGEGSDEDLADYDDLPEYDPTEHAGSGKRWTFPDRDRFIPEDDEGHEDGDDTKRDHTQREGA